MTSSLPLELQREIFELAVRSSNRDAALKLNLSLIAHHVHFWVDRVFYELVTISSPASADRFLNLIDSKPPGFFATVVKTLLLYDVEAAFSSQAARILSACDRVQWLLLLVGDMPAFCSALHRQLPLRFRRLYTRLQDVAALIAIPASPAWLSGITHLGLGTGSMTNSSDLEILKKLPRLTHVALWAIDVKLSHAETACASCPHLQILVMLCFNMGDAPLDSRVVLERITVGPSEDWEDAHFGRSDIWTRAEGVVAERRRSAAQQRIDETE
ncbi:hypothetical protein K438DRAFT_1964684 [Mycena galopus ATCC 62051]|nr:hypothetical protein K438DRAFT_1964684 [Mycena galopus ATCC 62051]